MSDSHAHHDPHLAHHFDSHKQQFTAQKLGMWLFLATEVLMFGGLFVAYSVFRYNHPQMFHEGHKHLNWILGATNTVILLFSSFTMAMAVRCAQLGNNKAVIRFLAVTFACALGFMCIKYVEYSEKIAHGHLLGNLYDFEHKSEGAEGEGHSAVTHESTEDASRKSTESKPEAETQEEAAARIEGEKNQHVFFSLYFMMTGLHGIHVLVGMAIMIWLFLRARKNEFTPTHFAAVDLSGLYWHIVDIVWIFLFPLFYLIS
ncbi:MAG: cytochrome c oxidase subunit 3 family protein [Planctomycetes bacterium]|nr:cytochrome c oxidase subunit 3 family protein [Planctomycetota bacterium]